jgi:hypothetical protein
MNGRVVVNEFNTVTAQNSHTTNAGVVHFKLPIKGKREYVVGGVQWQLAMTFDASTHGPPNVNIGDTRVTLKFKTVNQTSLGSNPQRHFAREMARIVAECICATGASSGHFANPVLDAALKARMRWKLASQCIFDDVGLWSDRETRGMFNAVALQENVMTAQTAFAMVMMPDTAQYRPFACTHVASGVNDGEVTGIPVVKGIWLDEDAAAVATGGYIWPVEADAVEQPVRCAFAIRIKRMKKKSPATMQFMDALNALIGSGRIFPVRQLNAHEEVWAAALLADVAGMPSIVKGVLNERIQEQATVAAAEAQEAAAAAAAAAAAEKEEDEAAAPAASEALSGEDAVPVILKGIAAYADAQKRVPFVTESSEIVEVCAMVARFAVTEDAVKDQVKRVRNALGLDETQKLTKKNVSTSATAYTFSSDFFSYLRDGGFPSAFRGSRSR